jgi:hypothetical protein
MSEKNVREWNFVENTIEGMKASNIVKNIHAKGMEAKIIMNKLATDKYIYKVYEGVAI